MCGSRKYPYPHRRGNITKEPPTPQDFPFSRYFLNHPHPFGNSLNTEYVPTPLWKIFLSKECPTLPKNQFGANSSEISRTAYTRGKSALLKSARPIQFHSLSRIKVLFLNTEIIVVFYIYLWSLTSKFIVSFVEDFKSKL